MTGIDAHLPLLERGLAVIKARNDTEWEPVYVINLLREQKAFLFVVDEGFYILRPVYLKGKDQLDVECVAAYSCCSSTEESLISKYLPVIKEQVRALGARRLFFDSPRRGYERFSEFSISTITYVTEVSNG